MTDQLTAKSIHDEQDFNVYFPKRPSPNARGVAAANVNPRTPSAPASEMF